MPLTLDQLKNLVRRQEIKATRKRSGGGSRGNQANIVKVARYLANPDKGTKAVDVAYACDITVAQAYKAINVINDSGLTITFLETEDNDAGETSEELESVSRSTEEGPYKGKRSSYH